MNKDNETGCFQYSSLLFQNLDYNFANQKIVNKLEKHQGMIVSSNPTDAPAPMPPAASIPIFMYGGIAVAVIISMTYFSQIQLKLITELIKTLNKKKR
ncbi:hypothetical protein [Calothrix sp. NIES-2100]|uniref:hypothetical protein n=1 Tax=Calothrix sp. NIES-2100 TaxID=1954172 RepID=UPI0030DCD736